MFSFFFYNILQSAEDWNTSSQWLEINFKKREDFVYLDSSLVSNMTGYYIYLIIAILLLCKNKLMYKVLTSFK